MSTTFLLQKHRFKHQFQQDLSSQSVRSGPPVLCTIYNILPTCAIGPPVYGRALFSLRLYDFWSELTSYNSNSTPLPLNHKRSGTTESHHAAAVHLCTLTLALCSTRDSVQSFSSKPKVREQPVQS